MSRNSARFELEFLDVSVGAAEVSFGNDETGSRSDESYLVVDAVSLDKLREGGRVNST